MDLKGHLSDDTKINGDLASRFSILSARNSSPSNGCVAAVPFFARRRCIGLKDRLKRFLNMLGVNEGWINRCEQTRAVMSELSSRGNLAYSYLMLTFPAVLMWA
jgi:hypothetical protein